MEVKIYTLSSSSNPDNIRYVGKTIENLNKRLSGHLTLAKRNAAIGYYHNHTSNWINSTLNKGDKVLIKELDVVNIKGWDFWEKYWISQFKTWGFNLTNLTDGGDGNQNMHFSPESNLARSKALLGTHRPEEVKLKISKGNLGKKKSFSHVENVRKAITKLQGKPVLQYSLDGKFLKEWSCGAEAARFYNVDKSSLMRCCQGHFKKSAGFVWKYKE